VAVLVVCLLGGAAGGSPSSPPPFHGDRIGDFWVAQSAPGAIAEVRDPTGRRRTVFRFRVGDRDQTAPGEPNPRAELISPRAISGGDELWWSAEFLLPRRFPDRVPEWLNLVQGPYGKPWLGPPPWFVKVAGGRIVWQRNATYDWDVPWQMPLVRGRWVKLLVHARFARRGFVEMWVDGRRVTFFERSIWNPSNHRPTRRLRMRLKDRANYDGPNSIYLQSYRKRGMFPSVTVYHGPLRIGPTRASVSG
jgi:hypothetical protein